MEFLSPLLQAEPLTLALVLAILLSLVLLKLVSRKER